MAAGGGAALQHALERLGLSADMVFEQVQATMALLDRNGTMLWQNRVSIERVGDLRGRSFLEAMAPEHRSLAESDFMRLVFEADPFGRREVVVRGPEGGRKRSMVMSAPIRAEGDVVGVLSVGIPITWEEEHKEVPQLSPRQLETLELLTAGLSTGEVAAELGVTVETTRNYIRRLLRSLGVHSRVEAVARGRELGLVTNVPFGSTAGGSR